MLIVLVTISMAVQVLSMGPGVVMQSGHHLGTVTCCTGCGEGGTRAGSRGGGQAVSGGGGRRRGDGRRASTGGYCSTGGRCRGAVRRRAAC